MRTTTVQSPSPTSNSNHMLARKHPHRPGHKRANMDLAHRRAVGATMATPASEVQDALDARFEAFFDADDAHLTDRTSEPTPIRPREPQPARVGAVVHLVRYPHRGVELTGPYHVVAVGGGRVQLAEPDHSPRGNGAASLDPRRQVTVSRAALDAWLMAPRGARPVASERVELIGDDEALPAVVR